MPRKSTRNLNHRIEKDKVYDSTSITELSRLNEISSHTAAAAMLQDISGTNDDSGSRRSRRTSSMNIEAAMTSFLQGKDYDNSIVKDLDEDFVPDQDVDISDSYDNINVSLKNNDNTDTSILPVRSKKVKPISAISAQKTGKRGNTNVNTNDVSDGTAPTKKKKPARIIRAMKDLSSAQDKLVRIYGNNREKLLGLAKLKEAFETHVFDFPEELLKSTSKYYVEPQNILQGIDFRLLGLKSLKYRTLALSEFNSKFPLVSEDPKHILVSGSELSLYNGQKAEFPIMPCGTRTGFIYNVGGLITDIAWLKTHEADGQILAVAYSNIESADDMRLRMIGSESHTSTIDIFELDTDTLSFTKIQTIVHNYGEVWDLKWHEGFHSENSIGLLGFVCQQGSVNFIEIQRTLEPEIRMIEESSLEVKLSSSQISCFDFISSSTIICGFYNGYVGEFQLGEEVPNFYNKLHETYVLSIVVAYSPYEETVVCSASVDGTTYLYNTISIKTTKCTLSRNRGTNISPMAYAPLLYSIVHTDGVSCLRAFTPRAIFATHQISQHKNNIGCIATSRLHPYLLSGSADGSVVLNNLVRRILQGIKGNTEIYKSVRLWKWDYNVSSNIFRLDPNYEVNKFAMNEISNTRIDPTPVNIQSIKWNENNNGGKFYAFANAAGLLVVEKLGD
ncbi:HHR064Cp [Eremothecium sinecaudum]|uniref:HHR064Cp n=1 Tax=Eremothecium sinecaudum TaxID=45286 RepID=A0A109V0U0_9SACH|nr:HHR064Cp [Eremothecium sinecaudum]AMD22833.1 HHR064Cp [Eremothecium sinecaudum]